MTKIKNDYVTNAAVYGRYKNLVKKKEYLSLN